MRKSKVELTDDFTHMHHENFEKKKRDKEFADLKRRNQEWLDRYLDEVANFLLDLWLLKQDNKKDETDEGGSTPTSH